MWSGNYFQALFDFQRILYQKESGALYADLDKFWSFCCYISSISSLIPKFHFPIEDELKAQTQKCLELVFRSQFFVEFTVY